MRPPCLNLQKRGRSKRLQLTFRKFTAAGLGARDESPRICGSGERYEARARPDRGDSMGKNSRYSELSALEIIRWSCQPAAFLDVPRLGIHVSLAISREARGEDALQIGELA